MRIDINKKTHKTWYIIIGNQMRKKEWGETTIGSCASNCNSKVYRNYNNSARSICKQELGKQWKVREEVQSVCDQTKLIHSKFEGPQCNFVEKTIIIYIVLRQYYLCGHCKYIGLGHRFNGKYQKGEFWNEEKMKTNNKPVIIYIIYILVRTITIKKKKKKNTSK